MEKQAKGTLRNPGKVMRRALKAIDPKIGREPLTYVHLDESGDVVATDSYRLHVEHGAWDGPSIDVPYEEAKELSKLKASVKEVEVAGGPHGFPNYKQLFEGLDAATVARLYPEQALPVVKEHVKAKTPMLRVEASGGDLRIGGAGGEEPTATFANVCDGGSMALGIKPAYLRDALMVLGEVAEIRMANPLKPVVLASGEFEELVMPMRLGDAPKPEPKPRAPKEFDREVVVSGLIHLANERAMNDPDAKVNAARACEDERRLVWALQKDGRLVHERTHATATSDYLTWKLDGEFMCCIEERWSKRKVKLHYPALTPKLHRTDKAAELAAAKAAEAAKHEQDAGELAEKIAERSPEAKALMDEGKLVVVDMTAENGAKARVTKGADGKAKAVVAEERHDLKETEQKEESEMNGRIEELERELAAARAAAEMWERKANEYYEAKPRAEEPPAGMSKAAAETSVEALREAFEADGTADACMAYLAARFEGEPNTAVTQKREGCPVWVEGDTKPFQEELRGLGLRWSPKRKGWYYRAA